VPGVTDLSAEANKGKPQLVIKVNREAASRYGINAGDPGGGAGIGGSAGRRSSMAPSASTSPYAWPTVPGRSGGRQSRSARRRSARAFSQVATPELDEGYSFVRRESCRYAVLQMDVKGRDVDSFVKEAGAAQGSGADAGRLLGRVGRRLREPAARHGAAGRDRAADHRADLHLLYTAFNSLRHATLIIANVPFAIIGGIVGLFVTGQYLSVPSAIGFIAVFGVAMLNGIVLVSFLNDQRRHGLSVREAVRQGAALRLRPVLMTASVAILGLIPMLLSTGVGAETQRPLATVVVGGLITSTALTLLLLPLIYEWAELRAERRKQPQPVPAIEGATHEGNQGLRPRQPHCRRHRRAEGLDRVGAIRITTNTTWRSTL
jgi:cobalt-zinc-cadmium resistance protein CzcA